MLLDTVDFAFGSDSSVNLKDCIDEIRDRTDTRGTKVTKQAAIPKANSLNRTQKLIDAKKKKEKVAALERQKKEKAALEQQQMMDSVAFSQGVGSVPYGLPCLAVTRRN